MPEPIKWEVRGDIRARINWRLEDLVGAPVDNIHFDHIYEQLYERLDGNFLGPIPGSILPAFRDAVSRRWTPQI